MTWLAREGVVRRIVDGALRGRAPIVFGGPATGRSTVLAAAAERLRERGIEVDVHEYDDAARELLPARAALCLRSGGLELHRAPSCSGPGAHADGLPIQRVPLVPLLRRDLRAWAAAAGYAFSEPELERAFRGSGGHAGVFAAWLDASRFTRAPEALEARVIGTCTPLFARLERELAHAELAPVFAWLAQQKTVSVAGLRRATGATKAVLDRLACAGPVSRTLGARAEIAVTCELYLRWRATAP